MHRTWFIIILFSLCTGLTAQSLKDLTFGADNTFDVVTWNIERFAKDGQTTADSVEKIIQALDAEIIALQEISDTFLFNKMIKNLADYDWFYDPGWYGGLAYVYKSTVIEVLDLYEIYTDETYWHPLPRAPLILEVKFRGTKYVIINNHFKCCGDGFLDTDDNGDEEKRRLDASVLIKYHIDNYLSGENVILIGDLNDLINDLPEHNVFQSFINDPENYLMADMAIAEGSESGWSYPNWPSHIDHIIITNELFESFGKDSSEVRTIEIDDYFAGGFWEYDETISDHRPVAMKLQPSFSEVSGKKDLILLDILNIYPNPSRNNIRIAFHLLPQVGVIEINNPSGQVVDRLQVRSGQTTISHSTDQLSPGIYFVKLISGTEVKAIGKFIKLK